MATGLDHQGATEGECCDHGVCQHGEKILEQVKGLSRQMAGNFAGVVRAVHVFPSFLGAQLH